MQKRKTASHNPWNSRILLVSGLLLLVLFLLLPFAGTRLGEFAAQQRTEQTQQLLPEQREQQENEYVPGILIIKLKDADIVEKARAAVSTIAGKNNIIARASPQDVTKVFRASPTSKNYEKKKQFGLDRIFRIKVSDSADIPLLASEYAKSSNVEYAEPEYISQPVLDTQAEVPLNLQSPTVIPNDPYFNWQWHHQQQYDHDMDSPEAWNIETGSEDVVIANLEEIEWTHEDLAESMWQNLGEDADADGHVLENIGGQWQFDPGDINNHDDDGNDYPDDFVGWDFSENDNDPWPDDGWDHGTGTAGAATARGNNAIGIAGVCWNCKIMALGSVYSDAPEAVEYAIENGVDIFSMSFTGGGESFHDVLRYADSLDVVLIAAVGNNGNTSYPDLPVYPAAWNEVLAVTMTASDDHIWFGSSYGGWTDVGAPGVNIWTTWEDNQYGAGTGTSMAAPLVAGEAGLIRSHNPSLTNKEIYSLIQTNVDPLTTTWKFGGTGRVNAWRALQYDSFPVSLLNKDIAIMPISLPSVPYFVDITGTAEGNNFDHYILEIGSGYYPTVWQVVQTGSAPIDNGIVGTIDATAYTYTTGTYSIRLTTFNTAGTYARDALVVKIYTTPTASLEHNDVAIDKGQLYIIRGTAASIYFDYYALQYGEGQNPTSWTPIADGTVPVVDDVLAQLDTANLAEGDYTIKLTVRNTNDEYATDTSLLHIIDNPLSLPSWPQPAEETRFILFEDIDDDSEKEIIAAGLSGVSAWNPDGTDFTGLRIATDDIPVIDPPAIGDIDGDGRKEIVVKAFGNALYVFDSSGNLKSGWPIILPLENSRAEVALGDMDGDGKNDIVVTAGYIPVSIFIFKGNGMLINSWQTTLQRLNDTGMSLADIDSDQQQEIIVSGGNMIGAWNSDGTYASGWPQTPNYGAIAPPVVGDVDNDGQLEIIQRYYWNIYILNGDGSILSTLTQTESAAISSYPREPVLADIDNDGMPEIIASNIGWVNPTQRKIYAWNYDGTYVPGWPVTVSMTSTIRELSSPVAVDINNDGITDIVVVVSLPEYNVLVAYSGDGTLLDTIYVGSEAGDVVEPIVADLNNDNSLEIFAHTSLGVYGYSLPESVYNTLRFDWPQFRHDAQHTGVYRKNCAGALHGQCSTTKPFFCSDGQLISRCQVCGCSAGAVCMQDGSCRIPTPGKPRPIQPA